MHTMRSRYIRTVGVLFALMLAFGTSSATRTATATHTEPEGCFPPTTTTPPIGIVVLDPGHGGSDSGAVAPNGLLEKDVVLDIADRARKLLVTSGYRVCLTRTTDMNLTNTQRAQYANNVHGDVFVLIHLNGSTDPKVNYTSTFWGKKSKDLKLSQHMLEKLKGLTAQEGDFVGQFASGALLKSNMEATLTESAFLTNDDEAKLLANTSTSGTRRDEIAKALADGISTWDGSRTVQ